MPASGAREKSTGRIERRITDLGLAYTSTASKEEEKLFIYFLQPPGCECHSALAFTFITVRCFTAPPSADQAANYMSARTCTHREYARRFLLPLVQDPYTEIFLA